MSTSRRDFLRQSSAYSLGFLALRQCVQGTARAAGVVGDAPAVPGYGPLRRDPKKLLDLPAGFNYKIISRAGDQMDDGLFVPGKADGMATFAGPDGTAIVLRNHEQVPIHEHGPFGDADALFSRVDKSKVYDCGDGKKPHRGGVTTLVFDARKQEVVRQFMSLAGTCRNCAGGPTPWNSWITCEETVFRVGESTEDDETFISAKDHGYCFEVPAVATPGLVDPIPYKDMGRFYHEAVAVDARTGVVYETEDREDGLFYRFLPNVPGQLKEGGRLQAMCVLGYQPNDLRNWGKHAPLPVGAKLRVKWIDMDHVEAPDDDLRQRGFDAGAARMARCEGTWHTGAEVYIACTNGGAKKKGQIWRYVPAEKEGQGGADDSGTLELFVESRDSALLEACDNITVAPWGDLIACEDRDGREVRLVGVTPRGELYTLANSHAKSEFAGATFTPDGTTLLVNIQHRGLTIAITGPWRRLA